MQGVLHDLKERLVRYVSEYDWNPEEPQLTLSMPLVVQFKSAVDQGATVEYTATFACGNQGDIRLDERTWRFRLPEFGRFENDEASFDSFLGMIDYHVHLIVAHEFDKLGEFAGEAHFESARRISELAMFDEMSDGWTRRRDELNRLMSPEMRPLRTLRWVTHTALWFRDVIGSDYEAWSTILIALELVEEIDDQGMLSDYWKANYRSVAEILATARDSDHLFRLIRLDSMDPQRVQHYHDLVTQLEN